MGPGICLALEVDISHPAVESTCYTEIVFSPESMELNGIFAIALALGPVTMSAFPRKIDSKPSLISMVT
jgi:hypothetical protein